MMCLRKQRSDRPTGPEYTYIWIDLPDASYQETIDAKKLGNSLYEILGVPFSAENLNQHDIVECKDIDEVKHDFVKVVKFSGDRTVHVEFPQETNSNMWLHHIQQLENMGADWTNSGRYFSISLPPKSYEVMFQLIQEWERQKLLIIEVMNVSGVNE